MVPLNLLPTHLKAELSDCHGALLTLIENAEIDKDLTLMCNVLVKAIDYWLGDILHHHAHELQHGVSAARYEPLMRHLSRLRKLFTLIARRVSRRMRNNRIMQAMDRIMIAAAKTFTLIARRVSRRMRNNRIMQAMDRIMIMHW